MRTTIKDIAKKAGVSPATVSLVLNSKPVSISANTKKKVFEAAKELNYRPNQLAVSLVTNTTNTIGLIIPDSSNPFFAKLSNEIEKELRNNGINVIIGNTNGDPIVTQNYLTLFADRCVDGIILAQLDFEDSKITKKCQELITSLGVPTIFVDRAIEESEQYSVYVDQVNIGYTATKHLIDLGHKKIGCATGSLNLKINSDRYAGYKNAMSESSLKISKNYIYSESLTSDCGINSLSYLLEQNVTAIFAFNDLIAYGIYKECHKRKISIPDELSVIGVDDIFFSDIIQPSLTTIMQPINLIGKNAVNGILQIIKNPNIVVEKTLLDSTLVIRESTTKLSAPKS
ncbi:MAG: LacI family DNA-binding transcriptional regulator [Lachnospirales bacterium]